MSNPEHHLTGKPTYPLLLQRLDVLCVLAKAKMPSCEQDV